PEARRATAGRAAGALRRAVRSADGGGVGRPAGRGRAAVRLLRPEGGRRGAGRRPAPVRRDVPPVPERPPPAPRAGGGPGTERQERRGVRRVAPEGRGELQPWRAGGSGRRTQPGGGPRGGAGAVRVQAHSDGA